MTEPEAAPITLGIVGGGQLGRMLAMAAARLGMKTIILDPAPDAPAAQLAHEQIVAAYDDLATLAGLARQCDALTYEFENVPAAGLDALSAEAGLRPGRQALAVSQDRLDEKRFVESLGLAVAPFHRADSQSDIVAAARELGRSHGVAEVIVKTRRLGYDGKGQRRLAVDQLTPDSGSTLFDALGRVPLVVEAVINFECEISVIGARGLDGRIQLYDPARNSHEDGILSRSVVPAGVPPDVEDAAWAATTTILNGLSYVGVIGVEFFVNHDGSLTVNEFAPRVHNSGHWTEAACLCSQFEQHVRAVTGMALGDPARHSNAVMENLLGDPAQRVAEMTAEGDWMIHLYGKAEARPGRKMGHATRLTGSAAGH